MTSLTLAELGALLDRLHRHKTVGYVDAWRKRGELMSIFTNIARKYDRLEVALDQGVSGKDERLIDTAADLTVYAGKYLTWLAEQEPAAFDEIADAPPAVECSDAVGAAGLQRVLEAMVDRAPGDASPSLAEAWQNVRETFRILERGLMQQADPVSAGGLTWAEKMQTAWNLMVSSGWLTIAVAAGDPSAFADWRAEIDAMDEPRRDD